MNPLLYLAVACSASMSLVVWQQRSIERVHRDIARLSGEIVTLRNTSDVGNASLDESRARLNRLRIELHGLHQDRAALVDAGMAALTPQHEGWWPKERDYFYLKKSHLAQVRFRKVQGPIDEINALLTRRAAAADPSVISLKMQPDSDGQGSFDYRLFEGDNLNPDMASLLGMDGSTTERVERIYAGMNRALRELEGSRIQRVDPPQPAGTHPGQVIVARIPDLSEEVNPLWASVNDEWQQILGERRAKILVEQAEEHLNQFRDKLGRVPREFIRDKNMLIIQYTEPWGKRQSSQTVGLPLTPGSEFNYLFGPGAPCELK
jgi:hypothetical protein